MGTLTASAILLGGVPWFPKWCALGVAYIISPVVGLVMVGLFLHRYPDARFVTKEKIEGFGYVWAPLDVLAPYGIIGLLVIVIITLLKIFR